MRGEQLLPLGAPQEGMEGACVPISAWGGTGQAAAVDWGRTGLFPEGGVEPHCAHREKTITSTLHHQRLFPTITKQKLVVVEPRVGSQICYI